MSDIFKFVLDLVERGEIRVSIHGYDRLYEEGIFVKDIIDSIEKAIVVEEYPDYPKGPCVLVLQKDRLDELIHVVWGIPKDKSSPAVIVTAYRPDPNKWMNNFTRRKK